MTSINRITPITALLLLVPALALAMCTYEDIQLFESAVGKTKYCEYKGMKILVGARFKDFDECMYVKCKAKSLVKCGFGKKLGIMLPPTGCKTAFHGCFVKIIQDPDSKTKCPVISP
ncbi:beta-microseminoprotein-like [Liolophura sinensis]|uniref:beta-microseminoprotein-like n=1 Tax=Liolophura sinensis TaxID=3198878 RepID=UPI003159034F